MNENFENLKTQYPEYLSLDQFYRICRIAKRSARYLVEHGIVPAVDTGRKTWRYQIHIDDTISYLRRREQFGSMIPFGSVSSRSPYRKTEPQLLLSVLMNKDTEYKVRIFFEQLYANYDDALTVPDIIEMTGLNQKTILLLLKNGEIKSLSKHPRYIIPKIFLLDFVASLQFIKTRNTSEIFSQIQEDFEIWFDVCSG